MKKSIILLLATFFSITSFAQKVFQSGSYTTKTNQTFTGFIKINSDEQVIFKTSKDSENRTLTANEIEGFTITDPFKKYISLKEKNQTPKFYAYVIDSEISLLILDKTYFINDQKNGLNKLEIKKIEKSTDKGVFESTIKSYVGVLSYYSQDCPELQSKVNSVNYNRNSLSKYVIKLNECNNSKINDYTVDKSVVNLIEVGITAGGNFAKFETRNNNSVFDYETNDATPGINIGAFISYSPNIRKYNLTFLCGLEYNQKKGEISERAPANIPGNGNRIITHETQVIEPYISAIYQPFYNKKWMLSPYIGIGSSYGINLSHNIEQDLSFFQSSSESFELDSNQGFSILFRAGTFINIKNIKLFFEVAFSNYPYKFDYYGSNTQVKIGYVFRLK